jgi:hypothetical protein
MDSTKFDILLSRTLGRGTHNVLKPLIHASSTGRRIARTPSSIAGGFIVPENVTIFVADTSGTRVLDADQRLPSNDDRVMQLSTSLRRQPLWSQTLPSRR